MKNLEDIHVYVHEILRFALNDKVDLINKNHRTRIDATRVELTEELTCLVELIDSTVVFLVANSDIDISSFFVYFE